jgi:general secretion pathway protein G
MNDPSAIIDYASRPKRRIQLNPENLARIIFVLGIAACFLWACMPERQPPLPVARLDRSITQIANLRTALETFNNDCGRYPTAAEGLDALVNCPPGLEKVWHKQMDEIPIDSWGNPFRYRSPGLRNPDSYDLDSAGPDGIFDTPDDINKDTTFNP